MASVEYEILKSLPDRQEAWIVMHLHPVLHFSWCVALDCNVAAFPVPPGMTLWCARNAPAACEGASALCQEYPCSVRGCLRVVPGMPLQRARVPLRCARNAPAACEGASALCQECPCSVRGCLCVVLGMPLQCARMLAIVAARRLGPSALAALAIEHGASISSSFTWSIN